MNMKCLFEGVQQYLGLVLENPGILQLKLFKTFIFLTFNI